MYLVYIIRCSDNTLYTGITTNIAQRIERHNSGNGARYTRGRGPVMLLYTEKHSNRSEASKQEHRIKHLSRIEKLKLIHP